ncbi:MAG: conjugal transfer protein TraS [Burkholderiales bacterium]
MTLAPTVDGILVQWGERLFYPSNRIVKSPPPTRLDALPKRAGAIRARIVATVSRRAPQVMVKVTGGGRGMAAIAAHFRYISKNGRLQMEDERGVVSTGKDVMLDLLDEWRHGGSFIDEVSPRREAFNLMLSMPQGTDPAILQKAAREFIRAELKDHLCVMVLHEHQANPHVHIAVRAESRFGTRLNPRKADLHRWRETFAEKLRGWGVEAEATRQATRGANRQSDPLWRIKAREAARLRHDGNPGNSGGRHSASRAGALEAWAHIARALGESDRPEDRRLAGDIARFVRASPMVRQWAAEPHRGVRTPVDVSPQRQTQDPGRDIGR